jgi:hypothetical protein
MLTNTLRQPAIGDIVLYNQVPGNFAKVIAPVPAIVVEVLEEAQTKPPSPPPAQPLPKPIAVFVFGQHGYYRAGIHYGDGPNQYFWLPDKLVVTAPPVQAAKPPYVPAPHSPLHNVLHERPSIV